MSITIEIKLKPFTVPNFAIVESPIGKRYEGWEEAPKYPLSELSPNALADMCEHFTRSVFEKAGKERPTSLTIDD